MRITWIANEPTSYLLPMFNAIASRSGAELFVLFTTNGAKHRCSDHPSTHQFESFSCDRPLALLRAVKKIRCRPADLTIVGGWHGTATAAILAALIERKVPFALWTDTPDLERNRPFLKERLRTEWLKYLFARAKWIMGTGAPALHSLARMGAPSPKLINFPYFVDLDFYSPASPRGHAGTLEITSVARLVRSKGHDVALHAIAELVREPGGAVPPLRYTIIGEGEEQRNLTNLAGTLGIAHLVKFPGWYGPAAIRDQLRRTDILLHPSRAEPYGVVILEAMATAVPVIASGVCGAVRDRFVDGVNGIVHRSADAGDLAAKLRVSIRDAALRKRLRIEARRTAEQWPLERAASTIENLISNGSPVEQSTADSAIPYIGQHAVEDSARHSVR